MFESFGSYPLNDANYKVNDFYMKGNLNLYNERVMAFDEWDTHYPIMTAETVQYPDKEMDPLFYRNKMVDRG